MAADRLHPLRLQLRDRGPGRRRTRSRGSRAIAPTPARRATPARRRSGSRTTSAIRGSPRRCAAAPTAPSRRSTGTRRSPRSPAGWPRSATSTAARRSSTTAAAGRATTSAAPTRGATRSALGSRFSSNALAQEKTGELWIDAHMFGRVAHTAPDFEHAEVAVFVGKNPWMSHGFPHARPTLKAIAGDPERALIVIDPRRTETAELADIHLQVRPGHDAHLLAALLAILVEEDWLDRAFLEEHAANYERILAAIEDGRRRRLLPAGGRPRGARPRGGAEDRRRRERLDPRGPRDPAGPELDAQLLPREADLGADRQLRPTRLHQPPHAVLAERPVRALAGVAADDAGHRRARDRRDVPGRGDPRGDPHRRSGPLPRRDRREQQPRPLAARLASGCARRWRRSTSASSSTSR